MSLIEARFIRELNIPEEKILANVQENMALHVPRLKQKRAVFVAGAPSVADYLDEIRAKQNEGFAVFSMNGSAKFLMKNGIAPDFHVLMDARKGNVDFVKQPSAAIKYLVSSQCDPIIFEWLAGFDVTMWHAAGPAGIADIIHESDGRSALVCGGGTVGMRSLYIAYMMGYTDMVLYGYDSSNRGMSKHAYEQAINEGQPVYQFSFNGAEYEASGPMAAQAEDFPAVAQTLVDLGVSIELRCSGLLPAMWEHHKAMQSAPAEQREAYKYERMWATPEYRSDVSRVSLVNTAITALGITSGRVVDFGCGAGYAMQEFRRLGFDVLGVDITSKCLSPDIMLPLCIAPLWDIPSGVRGDFGYCTDVLEHIPPEKLDAAIAGIMRATPQAFFQICFVDDKCGALIGMPLHLSVHPYQWWIDKFEQHGLSIVWSSDDGVTGLFHVERPTPTIGITI